MATVTRARTVRAAARRRLVRHPRWLALGAVAGPGVLAGLSDDDPAGITTYSILGADFGYRLIWVLVLSTLALIVFHELGARMGVVTGSGLATLIRRRYGGAAAIGAAILLLGANIGTTCAEFAGVAVATELAGISRYVSVPMAALLVSTLVVRGSFRFVEHVLLALSAVFLAYIASGLLARPDWGAAARGAIVPSLPLDRHAALVATATVGTTLAPWGLAFIQSYAVDKRLSIVDLAFERIDVVTGAVMTGVIGFFIVIACAATLHTTGTSITDAGDAAAALRPLAGHLASTLFGLGLLGAALLAAAILPLSSAYSVSEAFGRPCQIEAPVRDEPVFYGVYALVVVLGAGLVLIPHAPLVPILFLTQALNAILLLPLLAFIALLTQDRSVMGEHAVGRLGTFVAVTLAALIAAAIILLGALSLF
jgi:NRAMP (natural resistance-associated macrophage protein)-like metal ion transporter